MEPKWQRGRTWSSGHGLPRPRRDTQCLRNARRPHAWRPPDSRRVLVGGEPLAVTSVADMRSRLAHVHDGTQLYTDGSKIRGEVGAGVHDASTAGHPGLKMKVNGAQTVNRAEMVAILEAVRYAPTDDDVVKYTDSMESAAEY